MDEQAIVKWIPTTVESDADGVKMSLEAARALALSGEPEEALRLLRRAVDAAEQAGDDMRSIALARAAADIANEIERMKKGGAEASDEAPSSKKFPSPPSRKSVPTPPPMPASSTSVAPNAPSPPSTRASQAPAAPTGKSSPHAAPPPQEPAPDAHSSAAPPANAPGEHASPDEAHSSIKADPAHAQPAPAAKKVVETRLPAAAPHVAGAQGSPPPPGRGELLAQGRAVRVLVKRSARDESLYIVRPHATAHVPVGAREAFLVLGEPDADFLAGATR